MKTLYELETRNNRAGLWNATGRRFYTGGAAAAAGEAAKANVYPEARREYYRIVTVNVRDTHGMVVEA
jgi:hypothetical protein